MNLETFSAADWGDAARQALDGWRQGDILETGRTLIWTGPGGLDPITNVDGENPLSDRVLVTETQPAGTGLSVITSQTCDVIGQGPGAKQPWVHVSPICRIPDEDKNLIADIQDRRALNYFKVSTLADDACYAVDLRLTQAISKALLLSQRPRRAFDEALAPLFAEQLSMKAGRASLHDLLSDSLARSLGDMITNAIAVGTWPAYVEQFRIGIRQGTPLRPLAFYLLVVTEDHPDDALIRMIERRFDKWKKTNRDDLRKEDLVAAKVEVRTVREIPVPTYRDTFPLAVRELGARFWY